MRTINLIVVHCSATREDKSFTEHDLDVCHRRRGFNGVGYHFYIRKNGDIKSTRPLERIGAHSRGFNRESIGICYEGGLDCMGQPKDTRTCWQKHSLRVLILTLLRIFRDAVSADIVILVLILTETVRLNRKSGSRLAPVSKRARSGIKNRFLFSFTYSIVSCYWLIVIGY